MKVGVFLCHCGSIIAERIDLDALVCDLVPRSEVALIERVDFLCGEGGRARLREVLAAGEIERVVIAACSPREHESTFRRCLAETAVNPYQMQMVNIREQIAWTTPDREKATERARRAVGAAVARVVEHEALLAESFTMETAVLVVGAGPAGMKAALALAEGGRSVVLVEKSPAIGGLPVQFEELFPTLECGPCLLEPLQGEILHGPAAGRIELLTGTTVAGVTGYFGNFNITLQRAAQHIDAERCIGCSLCVEACPVAAAPRKAIDFAFPGALPHLPVIDGERCLRRTGEDCRSCAAACPVAADVIDLAAEPEQLERRVGAVLLAIGGSVARTEAEEPDVLTQLECEQLLSSNGPTAGELLTTQGQPPRSVAFIHCSGRNVNAPGDYCSGVCCQEALKLDHLLRERFAGLTTTHFFRQIVAPGKKGRALQQAVAGDPGVRFVPYDVPQQLIRKRLDSGAYRLQVGTESAQVDLVVEMHPFRPSAEAARCAGLFDFGLDTLGFFEELADRLDATQSRTKGIYFAGACQGPMDIQQAALQGLAAAGQILSGLQPGRQIEVEPIIACVDDEHCSGCGICLGLCPFRAVNRLPESRRASVNPLLCHGCGTCVASCPGGAMQARHFSRRQLRAELTELLR